MDLDFAGWSSTELERNWCNSPFWKKTKQKPTNFLWKAYAGHCRNLCHSKGLHQYVQNTYCIFNSCLSRRKIILTKKCRQSFAGGRGRRFFHQTTAVPWIVTGLATDFAQVKKVQLTCFFCLRFQATNSVTLEGILKIKMNLCCLDCVVATWDDCFKFYI